MKQILALAILSLLLLSMAEAHASDYDARVKAAAEYEEVMPVKSLMDDIFEKFKEDPNIQKDPALFEIMISAIDKDKVRDETISLMAKNFTLEELVALKDFYSTDVGQSIYKKMPEYMSQAMPLIQKEVAKGVQAMMKELQKRKKEN